MAKRSGPIDSLPGASSSPPRVRRAVTAPAMFPAKVLVQPRLEPVTMLDVHLARLSSQHHASAYNRNKRTVQGSSYTAPEAAPPLPVIAAPVLGKSVVKNEAVIDGSVPLGVLTTPVGPSQASGSWLPPTPVTAGPTSALLTPTVSADSIYGIKTSETHPMNISTIIAADILPLIATVMFGPAYRTPGSPTRKSPLGLSIAGNAAPPSPARSESPTRRGPPDGPFVVTPLYPIDLFQLCTPGVRVLESVSADMSAHGFAPPASQPFGNFVISSCPGKKVRLQGSSIPPIAGGRGGIRRDVRLDLQRAVELAGARAVICCLDDTELALLGAPWEEYSSVAADLDIIVYRIPIAEGYAPATPAQLDALLARVISRHTLRGETVLCHCRGGVGRAGLVGCCWIAKTGLVELPATADERETIRTVEQLVDIMRRRRSVKAIETPAQVQFLLRYVQYLTKAIPGTANEYRMRALPPADS